MNAPSEYTAFLVLFMDASGELQSAWELTDISIGRVAVRAYAVRKPGDVVAIDYAEVAA